MTDMDVLALQMKVAEADRGSSCSTLIPGLVDDIILYEIVCRLPWYIRPLLTLLSKAWRSALRQPAIYSARTRTLQKMPGLLLVHPAAKPSSCRKSAQSTDITPLDLSFNSLSFKLLSSESRNVKSEWTISMLDSASNVWRKLPPIPGRSSVLLEQSGVACLDGKIFVIGGSDPASSRVSGDVYMLDLQSGFWQWKQLRALCCPRYAAKCTAISGKVYVLGGYSSHENSPRSTYVRAPEVYDVAKDHWKLLPELPSEEEFSCWGFVPLFQDGNIFAYGRSFENDNWDENPVKIARIYDTESENWTAAMEFDYSSCCAVVRGYFHDIRVGVLYRYKTSADKRTALKGTLPAAASNATDSYHGYPIVRELISAGDDTPRELYALVRGGNGDGSECDRLLRGDINEHEEVSWHRVIGRGFPGCGDGAQILYLN